MKVIELFAGIGGFRIGLERTGHTIVWSNEWLEKPRSIYKYHFNEESNGQDIRTVDPISIPDADLICGGFPCATFSVAGNRTGLSEIDPRGSLFFEICRIASAKRTPYILLENVKGLLNNDNGISFGVILFSLDKLGYDVQWEVLNSKNFGVPQNRERVFIVANFRGFPRPKVFPIGGAREEDIKYDQEVKHPIVRPMLTPERIKKRQRGRRFKEGGEPAFTLGAQDRHGILIEKGNDISIRKLTPLECERLQGLPDNWTKYYYNGKLVPDSERYERCGRTVTIPIIEEIGKRLYNFY